MSPQHSSPAPAASRCRDALQVILCTEYKSVHVKVCITSRYSSHNLPGGGLKSYCVLPCYIGGRTKNTESFLHPPNVSVCSGLSRPLVGYISDSQRRFSVIDKHIKFNRMNGSPGDPPANRMHISYSQNFTPLIHYHVSIPATKATSRELTNFNHFLSLRTSSRTELAQARMRGPEINNNSTKNKG
jgi:hypothetical protein